MIIALLAILGVDLIVIAVLLAGVLSRRRWVRRQPEAFKGAIRVTSGRIHWLPARWRRGYGRWVRDILVWTPAPFLLRNILIPVDRVTGPVRPAEPGEIKRIGANPAIAAFTSDHSAIEIAAAAKNRQLLPGPGARRASDWCRRMAEPPRGQRHSAGPAATISALPPGDCDEAVQE